jgi:hypothetical protein
MNSIFTTFLFKPHVLLHLASGSLQIQEKNNQRFLRLHIGYHHSAFHIICGIVL